MLAQSYYASSQNCSCWCNWNCQSPFCEVFNSWDELFVLHVFTSAPERRGQRHSGVFSHEWEICKEADGEPETWGFLLMKKLLMQSDFILSKTRTWRVVSSEIRLLCGQKVENSGRNLLMMHFCSAAWKEFSQKPSSNLVTRSECLVQPFVESTQHNKWSLNCLIPAVCTLKAACWSWLWILALALSISE